jgi:hypothetical protein
MRHEGASEISSLVDRVKPSDDPETNYFSVSRLSYCGQKDVALRMVDRAIAGGYCSYPAVDADPFLKNYAATPNSSPFRAKGVQCQSDFIASPQGDEQ